MLRRCLFLTALSVLAIPLAAQNSKAPDLSGTWNINLHKSKLTKHSETVSEQIVITCAGSTIQFRETINGNESVHVYVADGKEYSSPGLGGSLYVTKASWKKSALITEDSRRMAIANFPLVDVSHFTDRWTLSGDGLILKQESTGFDEHQIFVYNKQ